jgi:hypothetical protein
MIILLQPAGAGALDSGISGGCAANVSRDGYDIRRSQPTCSGRRFGDDGKFGNLVGIVEASKDEASR